MQAKMSVRRNLPADWGGDTLVTLLEDCSPDVGRRLAVSAAL